MKEKYYEWHTYFKWNQDIIEPFLSSRKVIDIGCGNGWVGSALKKYNTNVEITGLDIDKKGLSQSQYDYRLIGDGKYLPIKNDTFDGVIAKDILEHTMDPLSMMKEFHRVLKTNGVLYISVPDVKSKTLWDDYSHIRPYTMASITHLLDDSGFVIKDKWYTGRLLGLGVLMDLFGLKKIPDIVKLLARLKILNRENIVVIAKKL